MLNVDPCGDVLPSWNAMLKACAINNEGDMSIHLLEKMQEMSVKTDGITFIMSSYNMLWIKSGYHGPELFQGYACMVDILVTGRRAR